MRKSASLYQQHCSTYQCDGLYWTLNETTPCPKCGISEQMIHQAGTNDRNAVNAFFSDPEKVKEYFNNILKGWNK